MADRDDELAAAAEGGTVTDLESEAPRRPAERPATTALPVRSRDRYERLGEHARGGLGIVTRAIDRELGRPLAIKEIREPGRGSEERFVREARITMRLEHPAIVPVHDAGRWESGEPFYAMKLVDGRTLKEVVQERPSLGERLLLLPNIVAVADAIAYAHERRVIHRDLKASNILLGAFGETIVIDWGLAKDLNLPDEPAGPSSSPYRAGGDATAVGAVVGTPSFMPPEQARGERVDERADVYALGALLYFVLSGCAPHEGASSAEVLAKVRTEAPPRLRRRVAAVPADLAAIVERAMDRDVASRYPSARELSEDLKRFQAGQRVSAHRYSALERAGRWGRRHKAAATVAAGFGVLAALALVGFGVRESRLRRAAEAERDRADQQTLALLEQQGRAELDAGRPSRAAVLLGEALRLRPASLTLRSLLTQAVRPLERRLHALEGHTHDVPYVAYSPDGSRIVTASTDKTVRIWSADTGALLATLAHADGVDAAEFSPDGRLLVTGALDDTVHVFDADTGRELRVFPGVVGYRVHFMPDGRRIVAASQRGVLRVLDATTGADVAKVKACEDRPFQIVDAPGGRALVVASWDGSVSFLDPTDFHPLRTLKDHDREVSSVAFSHDGKRMVTAESDAVLHVRDAESGAKLYDIRTPEGARWPIVAFSEDDLALYATAHDGVLRTYHVGSGALLSAVDVQPSGKVMDGALRPGGHELVIAGTGGAVSVWAVGPPEGYRVLSWPGARDEFVYPAVYTADGARILAGGSKNRVAAWEAGSGALVASFDAGQEAFSVAPDADGSHVLVGGLSRAPVLWSLSGGTPQLVLREPDAPRMIYHLAPSHDGKEVVTSGYDGTLRFFDPRTGLASRPELPLGKERMPAVDASPDGAELAVTTENGKLLLVERATGRIRRTIDASTTWIQDVEYRRDGRQILTSGRQDHTARIWDATTGAPVRTLSGHKDNIMQGTFSPDGRLVATAAVDHTAIVWDPMTGEVLRTLRGPDFTATFSPDGRELLTTGMRGYVVVWDATLDPRSPEALADQVRRLSPWRLVAGRLELPVAATAGASP